MCSHLLCAPEVGCFVVFLTQVCDWKVCQVRILLDCVYDVIAPKFGAGNPRHHPIHSIADTFVDSIGHVSKKRSVVTVSCAIVLV